MVFYFLTPHSILGPSRRRQRSWRLRSRRHDWRTSRGYGRGMRSRSCWMCRGTFRHNLHSFLVGGGWDCDDRLAYPPYRFLFHSRMQPNVGLSRGLSISQETPISVEWEPIPDVPATEEPIERLEAGRARCKTTRNRLQPHDSRTGSQSCIRSGTLPTRRLGWLK